MAEYFEATMLTLGQKMGVPTAAETLHCFVAFAGIGVAVAFAFASMILFG